jgi:hypothetical protein
MPDGKCMKVSSMMDDSTMLIRRTKVQGKANQGPRTSTKKRKKPGRTRRGQPVFKYGIEVPRDVDHAYELDEENGNNL